MKPSPHRGVAADGERLAERAAALLARPGVWLDAAGDGYAVRAAADRRRRPLLGLDEAAFRALVEHPGLSPREGGGWRLRRAAPSSRTPDPPPGRPGVAPGRRTVVDADGRVRAQAANLGESPLAWLARRRDARGRPWLTPAEAQAAERLREDVERSGLIGRLTMSWDTQPRARGGGRAPGLDPAERARAAKARVAAALEAVGPGLRDMLERVCLTGSALEAAERDLDLPRRAGKTVLKLALQRLAAHYRIG